MCVKISSHDKTYINQLKMISVEMRVMVRDGGADRPYFIEQGYHGRFH